MALSIPQWRIDEIEYYRDVAIWAAESRALTERHNAERAMLKTRKCELANRNSAIRNAQREWEYQVRQDATVSEIEDWMIMSI